MQTHETLQSKVMPNLYRFWSSCAMRVGVLNGIVHIRLKRSVRHLSSVLIGGLRNR